MPGLFSNVDFHAHRGKLCLGLAGLLTFGFWGVIVGLAAGMAYDLWHHFLLTLRMQKNVPSPSSDTALLTAVVMLARAYDLPGTANPAGAVVILRQSFRVDDAALRYVGRVMSQPVFDASTAEHAVQQLASGVAGSFDRMQAALGCLMDLARDGYGRMDRTSMEAIGRVAQRIGMHETEFTALATIKGYLPDAIYDPYQVLGLPTGASLEAAAKAYRRLMQEYHPDRWQGKSAVAMARAQERSVMINDAYLKIRKSCAA